MGMLGAPVAGGADPDVSVVVVTYNSAAYLEACLRALPAALRRHSFEVLVVDNASVDGSPAIARSACPGGTVIRNAVNVGFARANNQGFDAAKGAKILVLNPDTHADPGSLDRLADLLDARPDAGVAAPRLLDADRTDQGTARAFPTPAAAIFGRRSPLTRWWPTHPWAARYLIGRGRGGSDDSSPFAVDWVSGACLMVPREVAARTGGFDERFFLYWEDADWCRRIKSAGLSVLCDPGAEVVHDEGARRRRSARQIWAFHDSAYRYFAKHHLTGARRVLRPAARGVLDARALGVVLTERARYAVRGANAT
jgi:GT2 family glycosyltransferase